MTLHDVLPLPPSTLLLCPGDGSEKELGKEKEGSTNEGSEKEKEPKDVNPGKRRLSAKEKGKKKCESSTDAVLRASLCEWSSVICRVPLCESSTVRRVRRTPQSLSRTLPK